MAVIKTFVGYGTVVCVLFFSDCSFSKLLMGCEIPIDNIFNGKNKTKLMINDFVIYIQVTKDEEDDDYFNFVLLNKDEKIITPKYSINMTNAASIYDINIDFINRGNDDAMSFVTECDIMNEERSNVSIHKENTELLKEFLKSPSPVTEKVSEIIENDEQKPITPVTVNINDRIAEIKNKLSYASVAANGNVSNLSDEEKSITKEMTTDSEKTVTNTELSILDIQEKTELAQKKFIDSIKTMMLNEWEYYDLKNDFKNIGCFDLLKYNPDTVQFYEDFKLNWFDSPLPKEHFFEWAQSYLRKNHPHLAVVFGEFSSKGENFNKYIIYDIEKRKSKSYPRLDRGRDNKDFIQSEKEKAIKIITNYINNLQDGFEPFEFRDIPGVGAMFDLFYIFGKDFKSILKSIDYDVRTMIYIDFGSEQNPIQYPCTPRVEYNKNY